MPQSLLLPLFLHSVRILVMHTQSSMPVRSLGLGLGLEPLLAMWNPALLTTKLLGWLCLVIVDCVQYIYVFLLYWMPSIFTVLKVFLIFDLEQLGYLEID